MKIKPSKLSLIMNKKSDKANKRKSTAGECPLDFVKTYTLYYKNEKKYKCTVAGCSKEWPDNKSGKVNNERLRSHHLTKHNTEIAQFLAIPKPSAPKISRQLSLDGFATNNYLLLYYYNS